MTDELAADLEALIAQDKQQQDDGPIQLAGPPVRILNEFFVFKYGWQRLSVNVVKASGEPAVIEYETLLVVNQMDGSENRFYFTDADKDELLKKMTAVPEQADEGQAAA